jgi:hypothetical protein
MMGDKTPFRLMLLRSFMLAMNRRVEEEFGLNRRRDPPSRPGPHCLPNIVSARHADDLFSGSSDELERLLSHVGGCQHCAEGFAVLRDTERFHRPRLERRLGLHDAA